MRLESSVKFGKRVKMDWRLENAIQAGWSEWSGHRGKLYVVKEELGLNAASAEARL
jgi:hypothetical protein